MSTHQLPEIQQLQQARAAAASLSQHDRRLQSSLREAIANKDRILSAPAPVEETVQNMRAAVAREAAECTEKHGFSIARAFGGGLSLATNGVIETRRPQMPDINGDSNRLSFSDLCGMLPDLMQDRLDGIIRAELRHVPCGPPLLERGPLLEAAEQEIRRIEDEHTALVDSAASLDPPIVIALLPTVRARRDSEAIQQRRSEEQRAARAAREAAVNSQRAPDRVGQAKYLNEPAK